jgi:predicted Zn-ribbon and HTH transcriptional regulator
MSEKVYEDRIKVVGPKEVPATLPGPIGDILERLEKIGADMEILTEHVKSTVSQYEHHSRCLDDLDHRLKIVEAKTFSLATKPNQRNCLNCGRKMSNPHKCGICGTAQPE